MDNIKRVVIVHSPNSTRAKRYSSVVSYLADIYRQDKLIDIELTDVPYFQAIKQIVGKLRDGDLVVAAGGDGITQVTANAVYLAKLDTIFTTVPLGHGNDISRAINKKNRNIEAILRQPVVDFYPLNVIINKKISFAVMSYITFGATTVIVDYLNKDNSRRLRRVLKNLTPAASVPIGNIGEISKKINELDFPDFWRDGKLLTDDSIGFFLIPAAHNVLRLPKDISLASSEFFFHYAKTKDKNLAKKIFMAGSWALRFPGEMTELEELRFTENGANITVNISGDNIKLGEVKTVSAVRSTRPIRILANK